MKPMYGLTHDVDGTPRVVEPKTVKVGIGLAKGPAMFVWIDAARKWCVTVGKDSTTRFETKKEAQEFYRKSKPNAPERKYPQRLSFFVFSRISPDGTMEPDWDATEAHGYMPTEIDIIFVKDEPLTASYQYWTSTEKKCEGDGLNAQRILSLASTKEEKELAAKAAKAGEKTFPIANGCWTRGCPYAKPQAEGKPSLCKPHGRLLFQLVRSPRLGATAYFDTTGFRSISQIFSCLETFRNFTRNSPTDEGAVAGIPLTMVLRPYRTAHNGQAATQYGVSLEYRAENAVEAKRQLVEHSQNFRLAGMEHVRALPPAPVDVQPDEDEEVPPETAAAMNAEFNSDERGDDDDFADPEQAEAGGEDFMPHRKSEAVPPQQTFEADPNPGPQAIDELWNHPQEQEEAPPPPPPPAAKAGNGNGKWVKLLELCRSRGISDKMVSNEMGKHGWERAAEITDKGYQDLTRWALSQAQK